MTFSSRLREQADSIFKAVLAHPFVDGIAKQSVEPSALIHYVRQDIQYLSTYAKVYGLAIAKSPDQSFMQLFHRRIDLVLNGEITAHLNFCKVAGVDYDMLHDSRQMAPTAQHYATHMLSTAQMGQLGDIIAVLLPCHWIYVDIAKTMQKTLQPTSNHLFYDWISFYADDRMAVGLKELIDALDQIAKNASADELRSMQNAFLTSCQMEYKFFEMAYTLEHWPVPVESAYVY